MSRNYSVTEPHPSVPKSGKVVLGGGIGGAGNYKRYNASEVTAGATANGPPSRVSLNRPKPRTVMSGRGGAGNYKAPESEIPMFQFDEELTKRCEHEAPVYHIGRGGAANFVKDSQQQPIRSTRMGSSDSSASISSGSSAGSARRSIEGAFGRLTRKLSNRP